MTILLGERPHEGIRAREHPRVVLPLRDLDVGTTVEVERSAADYQVRLVAIEEPTDRLRHVAVGDVY
ncbi:MAG: hypothetical protein AB1Z98_22565 [Nannocystaceae bacterium]